MIELTMPKLGMSMTEGELAEWLVPDGAQVSEGEVIYSVESEKSTQEVEAPASGTLRASSRPQASKSSSTSSDTGTDWHASTKPAAISSASSA